jgi:ParB family transcriptional regulator, chromosome partitioning protein
MTDVETVEHFKENFKRDIFYKLIRYILSKQVHFGESNHVNNLTNISFYNAMQGYYKTKIANIEKEYVEERNKRETRLKEHIESLEKQIQELND